MRISGHKTRAVFDRYNIVNDEDLRIAAEKVSRIHEERKPATIADGYNLVTLAGRRKVSRYGQKL